jgi:hypothetical protein
MLPYFAKAGRNLMFQECEPEDVFASVASAKDFVGRKAVFELPIVNRSGRCNFIRDPFCAS